MTKSREHVLPILNQIKAELDRGREAVTNVQKLYSTLPDVNDDERENPVPLQESSGGHQGTHDISSKPAQERVPRGAEVNIQSSAVEESLNTNRVEEAHLNCDFYKPDDIDDGEISLGTKPGVPAEYEPICVHEAQLQTKDASLQEALKKVAKLEAAITETQKRCHNAEEKARKKSQDLKTAKMAIIDNNTQIDNLERRNSELKMTLDTTKEDLDKKHKELIESMVKYDIDYEEAMKFYNIHCELGDDLFYHMTYLEVMVANECGRLFFGESDRILKARAARYLPLNEACKKTQEQLHDLFMELNANDDFPKEDETAFGELRLPVEAPPTIDKTAEFSSFLTSGMEHLTHSTIQETRVVEIHDSLEPTTPEKSKLESNNRSDSEASPLSPSTQSNSEEGRPDSATSNEPEPESSMCEDLGVDSIDGPKVEGTSATEGRGLGWLLGYNSNPEESFYPQYQQGANMVDSSPEQVTHEVLSEGSPETEGPGLQWLLGFNAHPEEPFYPQYSQHDEEKDSGPTKMTDAAKNETLTPLMRSNPDLEESVDSQEPKSPNEARGLSLSTCNEPSTGPKLAWLLGYNPEPEEAFYPQYSQQHQHQGNSNSPASIEQAQEQTKTTVPDTAPIFEVKPGNHITATTSTESGPLAVDVSFAHTSKKFKEEAIVQIEPEDTASTASTELEQKETPSKNPEAAPIFTPQAQNPLLASTTPAPESPSVDISFGNTSQPFKAGAKPRMTRAQRREAAIKAQAEAMASKKKMEGRVEEEEVGKFGKKESRQERRAAERKAAKKIAGKQAKRDIWRL